MHTVCCDQRTAVWCAASRRELLAQQAVPGDLPLADVSEEEWTLERLHLCENPPRFPRIYFRFASDMLDWRGHVRVARGETVAQRESSGLGMITRATYLIEQIVVGCEIQSLEC